MNHDKDNQFEAEFQKWKSVSQSHLQTIGVPPTDFFVTKVMARLPNNKEAQNPTGWAWKIPSLALGMATLFLFLSLPQETSTPGVDDLLLVGETDAGTTVLLTDDPEQRDILSIAWEDPS